MNKILIICGPTATGKTALGIKLAQQYAGEIISADSRQVYTGMDIGTGKDILKNSEFRIQNSELNNLTIGNYLIDGIPIWGYDLVAPQEDFSLAHFLNFAHTVIPDMWNRGVLPIVVGGTGLYLKSLINPPASAYVKPDEKLRNILSKSSVLQLQNKLKEAGLEKFNSMNHSDQNNPRRLVRAIEIALAPESALSKKSPLGHIDQLWLGLNATNEYIDQRIELRVVSRLKNGFEEEIQTLLKSGFSKKYPSATATGYKQWLEYLSGKITKQEAISSWITSEKQYARRQLTWFKNKTQITWFNVQQNDWKHQVEVHMKAWYPKNNN